MIGSSLGLALKQNGKNLRLLGHDKDISTARAAVKNGAFDKAEWNLINACEQADLIILAIPLNGICPTLEIIAPYLKEGVVISDTSRTKLPVIGWAEQLLPEHAHFIGGNPIVSPTNNGYEYATADLFHNRIYCLTPTATTDEKAIEILTNLINIIGAIPFFIDATEHDGLITAVEHLPTVLSIALLNSLSKQNSWCEIGKMGGGLFEQISAGAVGEPDSIKDELLNNRDNLIFWLDNYIAELNRLRTLLNGDISEEELSQTVDKAVVERINWHTDYQKGDNSNPEFVADRVKTAGLMKRLIGFGR